MDRYKKIQTSIDGLVSKIINEDLGIDQINHSNLEQVFNPHLTGVNSVEQ